MAVIELPPSPIAGKTTLSFLVNMDAARFLSATVAPGSTATATTSEGRGNLEATVAGKATASAASNAGKPLSASITTSPSQTANLLRYRGFGVTTGGRAASSGSVNVRGGIAAQSSGKASATVLGGRIAPIASAVSMSAAPKAALATGGTIFQDLYVHVTGTPVFNNDADIVRGKPGTWTVPVTLRRGGSAGSRLPVGAAVVKWGEYSATPGDAFTGGIILTSDLGNAPYIDVFTVLKNKSTGVSVPAVVVDTGAFTTWIAGRSPIRAITPKSGTSGTGTFGTWLAARSPIRTIVAPIPAAPPSTTVYPWQDEALQPRVRMGNLRGVLGNTTDKWGIAMSTDLSSSIAPYIEASNMGLVIKDADMNIINGDLYVGDALQTRYMRWNTATASLEVAGTIIATGGNIDGVLSIGSSGGIYQGTGTFAAPTTGLKIWNNAGVGQIAGYNGGVLQAYFGTDGKLYAGGGNISIHAGGIDFSARDVGGSAQSLYFYDNTNTRYGTVEGVYSTAVGDLYKLIALYSAGGTSKGELSLTSDGNNSSIALWTLGNGTTDPTAHITLDSTPALSSVEIGAGQIDIFGNINAWNSLMVYAGAYVGTALTLGGAATPSIPAAGNGKIWWSSTSNLPVSMGSNGTIVPLGVTEISPPIGSFVLTGAAISATGSNQQIVFRDANNDTADTNIMIPTGWSGRTLYCDLIWWAGTNTQNVYWTVEGRYQIDSGFINTTANLTASAPANANNQLRKTTLTLGALNPGSTPFGLAVRIWRQGSHASDTFIGTAQLFAVRLYV